MSSGYGDGLSQAKIDSGAGLVPPTTDAAIRAVRGTSDLTVTIDHQAKETGVYPLVMVSYGIMCATGRPNTNRATLKSFLNYLTSADGQRELHRKNYAPLPEDLRTGVATAVNTMS